MKKLLVYCLLIIPFVISAQRIAHFETTFYFEDAIGNLDTIQIGIDQEAIEGYNPDFGEFDLEGPFDSSFEVRAANFDRYLSRMDHPENNVEVIFSKKIVSRGFNYLENEDCTLGAEPIVFAIQADNLPVTISWNKADFISSRCRVASFVADHLASFTIVEWPQNEEWLASSACIKEQDEYSTSFIYSDDPIWYLQTQEEVEGRGTQTVYGVILIFSYQGIPDSPCVGDIVATRHELPDDFKSLYPNPTTDRINFGDDLYHQYHLYDVQGRIIQSGADNSIDLHNLIGGMYLVRYVVDDFMVTEKIIKVD